ncbi:Hypothetical predicted protein, partial [Pelobates cultripes]
MPRIPGRLADSLRIQATFADKFVVHFRDSMGFCCTQTKIASPSESGQFLGFDIGLENYVPRPSTAKSASIRIAVGLWDSSPPLLLHTSVIPWPTTTDGEIRTHRSLIRPLDPTVSGSEDGISM